MNPVTAEETTIDLEWHPPQKQELLDRDHTKTSYKPKLVWTSVQLVNIKRVRCFLLAKGKKKKFGLVLTRYKNKRQNISECLDNIGKGLSFTVPHPIPERV